MDRLPKDTWQHIPIYFRYTKIRALNFEGTPPYLFSKGTKRNHKFFQLWNFVFFLLNFYCKYEASTAKIHAECFSGALKIGKNYVKKVKALHRICLAHIARILSRALFSLSLSSFILALLDFVITASLYCAIHYERRSIFEYCIH